ncbi:histone chaperone ASF1B [Tripterygium wilfordii]|uniref:Histone chaperone ASF1B n=1 Tax=Tripterygium wilfordii TaxID=458696 RepID=A0A7J7CN69_TRIWF|nr:histone chaperone ASF1B [Tripterygium wilfordii]
MLAIIVVFQAIFADSSIRCTICTYVICLRSTFDYKLGLYALQAGPPDPSKIREEDIIGVAVLLLTCSYLGQEFIRVGYYVNNDYDDDRLREEPPPKLLIDKVQTSKEHFNRQAQGDKISYKFQTLKVMKLQTNPNQINQLKMMVMENNHALHLIKPQTRMNLSFCGSRFLVHGAWHD